MWAYLPNAVTLFRFVLGPFLGYCIVQRWHVAALVALLIAMASDFYDGYIARRYDLTTPSGTFLDPLADKVVILSAFLGFYTRGLVSLWAIFIVLGRDILVTGLRSVVVLWGYELRTLLIAKGKTALQFVGLVLLLILQCVQQYGIVPGLFSFAMYNMIFNGVVFGVVGATAASGVAYIFGVVNGWALRKV